MRLLTRNLLFAASAASALTLLQACVGDGGYAEVDTDYYGPAYGGAVFYGHPEYHNDSYVGRPAERQWRGNDGGNRGGGSRGAPAAHPAASRPGGGGHESTTPEPRNKHP